MAAPPDDDMLREAARARGFRLVKSRRRKPGGDFGRYGLVGLDSGRECLGFGEGGLTATAEEVHAYLRGGEVASWKRSLIGVVADAPTDAAPAVARGKGAPAAPTPSVSKRGEEAPSPPKGKTSAPGARSSRSRAPVPQETTPKPQAEPSSRRSDEPVRSPPSEPVIREATRRDAAALAKLFDIPAASLAERLAAALRTEEPPLVADRGGPIGLVAWTIIPTLQHGPRGRITALVVAEAERRQGTGTRLLAEAEQRLGEAGIASVELSLDIDFDAPTAFLRRTGYARATNGYAKTL